MNKEEIVVKYLPNINAQVESALGWVEIKGMLSFMKNQRSKHVQCCLSLTEHSRKMRFPTPFYTVLIFL